MIDYLDIAMRLAGRYVKHEIDMPWVYSRLNPKGRYFHDDWLPGFKQIPRRITTYRLPAPSFKIAGNANPQWIPLQYGYPLAPIYDIKEMDWFDGKETRKIPHIFTMLPVHPIGQWSIQGVYLDGEIRPCYITWTKKYSKN